MIASETAVFSDGVDQLGPGTTIVRDNVTVCTRSLHQVALLGLTRGEIRLQLT